MALRGVWAVSYFSGMQCIQLEFDLPTPLHFPISHSYFLLEFSKMLTSNFFKVLCCRVLRLPSCSPPVMLILTFFTTFAGFEVTCTGLFVARRTCDLPPVTPPCSSAWRVERFAVCRILLLNRSRSISKGSGSPWSTGRIQTFIRFLRVLTKSGIIALFRFQIGQTLDK